jgi:hypothetical protein
MRHNSVPQFMCKRMREFFNYTSKRSLAKDEAMIVAGEGRGGGGRGALSNSTA